MGNSYKKIINRIGLSVLVDIAFVPGIFALLLFYSFSPFPFKEFDLTNLSNLTSLLFYEILPGYLLAVLIVLISELWPYFIHNRGFFMPTFSHIMYFCKKGLLILLSTILLLVFNMVLLNFFYLYSSLSRYLTLFSGIELLLLIMIIYVYMKKDLRLIYSYTIPLLRYQNIGFVEVSVLAGMTLLLIVTTGFYVIYLPYQLMDYNKLLNYLAASFVILLYLFMVYMPLFLDVYDVYNKIGYKTEQEEKGSLRASIITYITQIIIGLLTAPLFGLFVATIWIRIFGSLTQSVMYLTLLISLLYLLLSFNVFRIKSGRKSSWIFHNMRSMFYFLLFIFFPLTAIDLTFLSSLPPFQIVFLCYKNIYDILNIRFTIISLLLLRLTIVFLLISTILLFGYFFYKRNLIIHFHYFLLDKNILFGLVPAALLILTLILSVPLSSYINLYNIFGEVIHSTNEPTIIEYYNLNQVIQFTNDTLKEYEFCNRSVQSIISPQGNNYLFPFKELPPPSLYGAFIPMGLFIAIISSLIMFLGNMYRINKHFDAYIREYIGRYVDKSITQLRPIHRIFIAGYGMLGKKLTYTILQHQLVDPEMLGLEKKTRYYDIILVPFTEIGDLLKYEVAVNNLCIITLESEDLAINIDHPVLGKIGLMDVRYSAGERVYVPIILNDVSLNSILRYIKLVEPPPQKSFGYPIYIFMLIPVDKARSKAMYSLLNKTINSDTTNQVLLLMRARKSAEIIRIDSRILDGKLCFLYPEYLIGYIIGREIL